MPLRHFVHVVGFDVPSTGQAGGDDAPLVVLLDKVPVASWRETFLRHARELLPELQRGVPELHGDSIRFPIAMPMTRRQAGDIRAFVDRVNRLTFLSDKSAPRPG